MDTRRAILTVFGPIRTTKFGQRLVRMYRAHHDPQHAAVISEGSLEDRFTYIYTSHKWSDEESRSGRGSSMAATSDMRPQLERLIQDRDITSIFDAGCGDFNWMKTVSFAGDYTGGDLVAPMVEDLQERYGSERRRFIVFDLTQDVPPRSDLIICREVLFHLEFAHIQKALANFRASGSTYLLCTTDRSCKKNHDIESGGHRYLNMERAPFDLPAPLAYIEDSKISGDRALALFRLAD